MRKPAALALKQTSQAGGLGLSRLRSALVVAQVALSVLIGSAIGWMSVGVPPILRSPNGVMRDFNEIWGAGHAAYDPAAIRAPTLLVVGEWDVVTPPTMALALYPALTHAADRRLVLMAEATHFMALERHRARLFHTVQEFLQED